MTQLEKVATKSFNHWLEEGNGNIFVARTLFAEWVGENSPHISDGAKESWKALIVAIDWCFQDAGWSPNGERDPDVRG
jgi:hypothetical protein